MVLAYPATPVPPGTVVGISQPTDDSAVVLSTLVEYIQNITGASAEAAVSICDFPMPGSPTTSTWMSDRFPTCRSEMRRALPPNMESSSPALPQRLVVPSASPYASGREE